MRVVTFFILEIPDYKSTKLIYLYIYICIRSYNTGRCFEPIFMKFTRLLLVHLWVNPIAFGNNRLNRITDMGKCPRLLTFSHLYIYCKHGCPHRPHIVANPFVFIRKTNKIWIMRMVQWLTQCILGGLVFNDHTYKSVTLQGLVRAGENVLLDMTYCECEHIQRCCENYMYIQILTWLVVLIWN